MVLSVSFFSGIALYFSLLVGWCFDNNLIFSSAYRSLCNVLLSPVRTTHSCGIGSSPRFSGQATKEPTEIWLGSMKIPAAAVFNKLNKALLPDCFPSAFQYNRKARYQADRYMPRERTESEKAAGGSCLRSRKSGAKSYASRRHNRASTS